MFDYGAGLNMCYLKELDYVECDGDGFIYIFFFFFFFNSHKGQC